MAYNGRSIWTADLDEKLAQLWASGHNTVVIGAQMGITKNAVIGRAHRLYGMGDLRFTPRPSPIKRPAGWVKPDRPAPPPRIVPKLAPLPSLAVPPPAAEPVMLPCKIASTKEPVMAPPSGTKALPIALLMPTAPAKPVIVPRGKGREVRQCQFPTGESPRIRFDCTNPAGAGVYCEIHAGRCFIRAKRDQDGEEGESSRSYAAA